MRMRLIKHIDEHENKMNHTHWKTTHDRLTDESVGTAHNRLQQYVTSLW